MRGKTDLATPPMVKKLIFATKEVGYPTEGSCRFPLIVLQQTSLISTGVKSRVLQLRTHRSFASAPAKFPGERIAALES
jgi:hypothetical protein